MNDPAIAKLQHDDPQALVTKFHDRLNAIRAQVRKIIVGQDDVVEHLLTSLFAGSSNAFVAVPLSGGLAGMAGWLSSYPLDVVKSRLQTQVHPEAGGLGPPPTDPPTPGPAKEGHAKTLPR